MHAGGQGGLYENKRLVGCFNGFYYEAHGPLFSFRDPPLFLNSVFMVISIITCISLGFQAYYSLALEWPCFHVISEPSGNYRGTPSPFLATQLALQLGLAEALVSLYYPLS